MGSCKQFACNSAMSPASLAPATAGPEEGFVPLLISPGLRLQGNLITCKLHLFFNESTPTPSNPNRISTHQSQDILLTCSSEQQIPLSEKVRAASDTQHGLEECESKSSPSPTSTGQSCRPLSFLLSFGIKGSRTAMLSWYRRCPSTPSAKADNWHVRVQFPSCCIHRKTVFKTVG